MISSAVIIPDQEPHHISNGRENGSSNSPSLKRKLSHSSPNERKRPKVDTDSDTLNYDDTTKSVSPEDIKPKSAIQNSPPRRRPAPAVEEKKRNQRLFGSLLGTLSQSNAKSNPAHRKRDEIEARQRERLKREHEEQESARKRKKEDLAKKRRKEQRYWEEESQRLKHANMRAMAGFLQTKTEPVLYYLPWELRQDEEAQIQRQKDEAERFIQQELDVHPDTTVQAVTTEANEDHSSEAPREHQPAENGTSTTPNENGDSELKTEDDSQPQEEGENPNLEAQNLNDVEPKNSPEIVENGKDHAQSSEITEEDHHGDEGQEDDVIY